MPALGSKCSARLYAEELGISFRRLRVLGGEARLRRMSPDARTVMIGPSRYPNSQTVHNGGLPARNMHSRVPGVRSQAERVA
jgi:hypothetical protein